VGEEGASKLFVVEGGGGPWCRPCSHYLPCGHFCKLEEVLEDLVLWRTRVVFAMCRSY
jgi:hypothetical protein